MSVETLILLAFLVLVPLLQGLWAEVRKRNQPPPPPVQRNSSPAPLPPPVPRAPTPPIPPLPALEGDGFDMHQAVPAREAVTPATTASSGPRRGRRRVVSAVFRTRLDLRRAITAATILGPCRALDPY